VSRRFEKKAHALIQVSFFGSLIGFVSNEWTVPLISFEDFSIRSLEGVSRLWMKRRIFTRL